MSLKTWQEEFYPIPADKTEFGDALDHSLRKWEGTTPGNLAKHGVKLNGPELSDSDGYYMRLNSDSCALCHWHYNQEIAHRSASEACETCPIVTVTGSRCDESSESDDTCEISPYHDAIRREHPRVIHMINLLRHVKTAVEQTNKKEPK